MSAVKVFVLRTPVCVVSVVGLTVNVHVDRSKAYTCIYNSFQGNIGGFGYCRRWNHVELMPNLELRRPSLRVEIELQPPAE